MKLYITKYWQTKGIIEADKIERQAEETKYVWAKLDGRYEDIFSIGNDAFYTEEEAKNHIRLKAKKKIAQIEKTLIKLKNIFP
jgi:uncharacterized protein YdaU (DUF1376 family)